jgi:hypothetical protein
MYMSNVSVSWAWLHAPRTLEGPYMCCNMLDFVNLRSERRLLRSFYLSF